MELQEREENVPFFNNKLAEKQKGFLEIPGFFRFPSEEKLVIKKIFYLINFKKKKKIIFLIFI